MRCLALWATALALSVGMASAQSQSPVAELLVQGHNALNDLDYERAESVGRSILGIGERATRSEQADACRLIAAAFFPEELALQNRDSALHYLADLIRLTPNADIPTEISWPGLDSLLGVTRKHTFALWASPVNDSIVPGVDAEALFDVAVSHPSHLVLSATPENSDSPILLDSVGPVMQATLRLQILDGDTPVLESGRHELVIVASAVNSSRTTSTSFTADVSVPRLELAEVPSTPDQTLLLPEQTKPKRARNALMGVGLGTTTALLANTFRGSGPVADLPTDGRAYAIGATVSVTAIVMALLERPSPIPENITYNEQLWADFYQSVRHAQAENERRRDTFRATVRIVEIRQ